MVQKMADLPPERCLPFVRPFSLVGIDIFGPFYVRQGRSHVKRYGCVFTCFNIRAIHLEKLNGMDTDIFINAFVRFASRRGYPKGFGVTTERIWLGRVLNSRNVFTRLTRTQSYKWPGAMKWGGCLTRHMLPTTVVCGNAWYGQYGELGRFAEYKFPNDRWRHVYSSVWDRKCCEQSSDLKG